MSTTIAPTAPAPGLHRGVDFDTYWSWDAVNSSILKGFAGKTPAHVRYELDHGGKESTPALDLGWLTHLAVLEPERFEAGITIAPKIDKRTTAGKQAWTEFQAANAGKASVDPDDYRKVLAMRAALLAHPTAGEFLRSKGASELSLLWEDRENGLRCKARIDKIGSVGECAVIGELKTARDASRRAFEGAIYKFGYGVSCVHYLNGLNALVPVPEGNPPRRLVFLVVESEPPHPVQCFELDDMTLSQAELERQRYLRIWKRCVERNEWPGFQVGIETASYPSWVMKAWEDIDE